ncbi:MAG TPA: phospholipase D-like domain-containing protein [Longimicrobiaceae bacterium]|nr:phospholipase D-like domain-containing protein [Longimicrobiaceae bacterium]
MSETPPPEQTSLPARTPRPARHTGSLMLARALVRQAERAMVRASDAPLVRGNSAHLLVDGPRAFRAWLDAIGRAEQWIHLENYIIRDDRTGRYFRDALIEKANEGVRVRVLYDWLGCWATPKRFWRPLRDAGAEVRAFAPISLSDPLNWLRRDHRKVLAVDGGYASVAGMCIGDEWAGDPEAGVPPWRDTGVELRGPVAAVIDRAFARSWAAAGERLPLEEIPDPEFIERAGDVSVRVVEGEPGRSRIYRLSQFVAVGVERRLWITDPYFVTPPAITEAFAAAARDGVDVRIIVPAFNNWPLVGGFSRAGYRPLLEAGVRLFEWEGPMIHAKTAVADSVWTRVGSSNLNLASLLGNWELDVAILDREVAQEMEELFLRDMQSSVEVVVRPTRGRGHRFLQREPVLEQRAHTAAEVEEARAARARAPRGRPVGRLLGRAARAGSVLGRALVGERIVGREDSGWIGFLALLIIALAALGFLAPRVLAWPLAFLLFWLGIAGLFRAWPRDRGG